MCFSSQEEKDKWIEDLTEAVPQAMARNGDKLNYPSLKSSTSKIYNVVWAMLYTHLFYYTSAITHCKISCTPIGFCYQKRMCDLYNPIPFNLCMVVLAFFTILQ